MVSFLFKSPPKMSSPLLNLKIRFAKKDKIIFQPAPSLLQRRRVLFFSLFFLRFSCSDGLRTRKLTETNRGRERCWWSRSWGSLRGRKVFMHLQMIYQIVFVIRSCGNGASNRRFHILSRYIFSGPLAMSVQPQNLLSSLLCLHRHPSDVA